MPEISESAAEAMLDGAFGSAPPPKPLVVEPAEAPMTADEEAIETESLLPDGEGEVATEIPEVVEPEPEFEIEVDGQKETIRGKAKAVELMQKGAHYSKQSEEVARVREALQAQAQLQEQAGKFQQAALADLTELQAIDNRLAEYNKIDWAAAIDSDFVQTMKLQEQRAQLREARAAKLQELTLKQQEFTRGREQATMQMLHAEHNALLAKLPAWRNSEAAQTEKQAIGKVLREHYGYQDGELAGLSDHRALLVARDAMKYRELLRNKNERAKELRAAPPVNKPGAAGAQTQPNEKAAFGKFVGEFRKHGTQGNHRAQETALEKVLARTFK